MSRRDTFNQVARLYDEVRPGYSSQLYKDLLAYTNLTKKAKLLEIGCGTGQATLPLAKEGFDILCLEKGSALANVAKEKLHPYKNVRIIATSFEEYELQKNYFDLVFAATSFHWIDPDIKYKKSSRVLKTGGTLAVFWNKHIKNDNWPDDKFFEEVQTIYQKFAPELVNLSNPMDEERNSNKKAVSTGLFTEPMSYRYLWTEIYSAEKYIKLLNTYSDHLTLEHEQRMKLYDSIRALINLKFNGKITKHYETILNLVKSR
ncbi:class I SAM-dependent methyltransferase [Candidatus Roizmanbacteria bacterium]|nr:class I SAM-dependent methyltransferase [Candidatus Roizmanbacteria bacterium]